MTASRRVVFVWHPWADEHEPGVRLGLIQSSQAEFLEAERRTILAALVAGCDVELVEVTAAELAERCDELGADSHDPMGRAKAVASLGLEKRGRQRDEGK